MNRLDKWLLRGWDSERETRWERTRAKGKLRYIFGVGLAFATGILMIRMFKSLVDTNTLEKIDLPFHLIQALVAGILFGVGKWISNERGYHAYKASKQNSPSNNGI